MLDDDRKVLVVDDDEDVREYVAALMETEGWQVVEAVNGEEGVEVALAEMPTLIILDVDMPVKDGFEAFRELREDPRTEQIPVIMLTAINETAGEGSHSAESMHERYGVNAPEGFVDKPVDPTFLWNTIFGVVG